MAEPKGGLVFVAGDTEEAKSANQAYQDALQKLTASLEARQNRFFDPTLLAIAEGMLGPTRTGSFAEALGRSAEKLRQSQGEEERKEQEIAQARMGLAQQQMQLVQQKQKQQALQNFLSKSGRGMPSQDVLALAQYDPAFAKFVLDYQKAQPEIEAGARTRELKEIEPKLFTRSEDGKVNLNPEAFSQYVAAGGPEAGKKVAETIESYRKSGLMENLRTEGATPFDAVILFANQLPGSSAEAYGNQAKQLAKQYEQGVLPLERANALANTMMQSIQTNLNTNESLALRQMTSSISQEIQRQRLDIQQQRLEEERKAAQDRLTDEQKLVLRNYVTPIVQEGIKGQSALLSVQSLRDIIEKAPSGVMSGAYAKSVGALFGTDENTALRRLETTAKSLIPQIPRLPGAASNLDSENLEKSLGKLTDVTLTNQQRRELVNDIYTRFKRLVDRADRVNDYWQTNKSFSAKVLEEPKQETQPPAQPQGKPMPTGDKLKAYADQYFSGDQQKATRYLQSQGYR